LTDRTIAAGTKAGVRQRRAVSSAQAYELAVARHRAGRLDEAEQLYRAVLKVRPDHFGALHYLGLACTQGGKFDEALTLLQQAVALDPNSAEARTNFGIALAALQRPEEAMVQYQKAIALQPDHAEARNNLGIVLQGLQRHEEAAAQFEAALLLQPDKAYVHNNLGTALAALDRHAEAVAACRKAIELNPRLAEACNNLGRSLAALDRHEEAVVHYRQAVALKPDYAEAYGNLGAVLNKLKRHGEAIAQFERALEFNPGLAEAHADIGNALVALERHQEAIERYRRALGIKPAFAAAHSNIGNALVKLERHGEAILHLRAALGLDPEAFQTHVTLGRALVVVDRHDEAVAAYRKAIELRPDNPDVYWLLGCALEAGGRGEEAIAEHRRALALNPEFAWAHNTLGSSLITFGRLAEGRRSIERALELMPAEPEFHRNLAMSGRFTPGDSRLQAMEELRCDASLSESQRMGLQYALGKAYADLGRPEIALPHLVEASAIKRSKIKYDEAAVLGQLEHIKAVMTRELIEHKSGYGFASDVPVFIVGMPRSGSTLIEQILASHPDVFGAGELPNFGQAVASLCSSAGAAVPYTEIIPDMAGERLGELGARYIESVRTLAPQARRITDKLLANFRVAGLIHLALPGAKIIHARRDPIDTCLSCFEREFAKDHQPFTYDLAELGRYYRAYDGVMAHWRRALPEHAMLEVRYEELIADFEPQARRVLAYCGLDWDARCLAFHRTERPVRTSSAVQVREPLYRSSIGRWHSIKHLLRPLLDGLERP
jgi:tetratricopeptide (TPR) repeat protein